MTYKALYRTYRPQKFSEVVGQDHIVRTLKNSLINNKISHAYLFTGPRGTGKTSVARILAKALNCRDQIDGEPCGKCINCKEIAEGVSPDVVEIDAASNNGVDEIRDIRDKVRFLPAGSAYKVYIIDEVHMLTQGAFNALLKTLEEPPKHVVFILATTEPHKVIPTIISRCQRFDFKTLTVKEIASLLEKVAKEEKFKISDEAIIGIAEGAEGGMRDALGFLDQAASFSDDEISIDDVNNITGNLSYDKLINLASYIEDKDINNALNSVNDLVMMGKEVNKVISGMLQFYRDLLLYKNVDTKSLSKYIFEQDLFKELASKIDSNLVFYYVDVLSDIQTKLRSAANPAIYLDVAIIKIINGRPNASVIERLDEIEERLASGNISSNSTSSEDDKDRINQLEGRLLRVVNELSRLELPELQEKVERLSKEVSSNNPGTIPVDTSKIEERLTKLESQDQPINNNTHSSDDLSKLNEQVNTLNEKIDKYQEIVEALKKEVDLPNKAAIELNYELSEVVEKLNNLEARLYELSKEHIEEKSPHAKPKKKKAENGQIDLFASLGTKTKEISSGDDLEEVDAISKNNSPENSNVDESSEERLVEIAKSTDDDKSSNSNNEDIGMKDSIKSIPSEGEDSFENEVETVKVVPAQISLDLNREITLDDFRESDESSKKGESPKKEVIIKEENGELIRENSHSQLVRRAPSKESVVDEMSIYNDTVINKLSQKETMEKNEISEDGLAPIIEHKANPLIGINDEDYNNYDVLVIERILHASRTPEARSDQTRIVNLWRSMQPSDHPKYRDIIDLLQSGVIVAVGKDEFILSYPNSALCNQVMKIKFKEKSLNFLYEYFGGIYNYMAIPETVWKEKRIEYINQYNIGVRYPKLTPIIEPSLYVNKEENNHSHQEEMARNAQRIFGEDIVKIDN